MVWEERSRSENLDLGDDNENFGLDVRLKIELSSDQLSYKQLILVAG